MADHKLTFIDRQGVQLDSEKKFKGGSLIAISDKTAV
jgi:hypothetical protein